MLLNVLGRGGGLVCSRLNAPGYALSPDHTYHITLHITNPSLTYAHTAHLFFWDTSAKGKLR